MPTNDQIDFLVQKGQLDPQTAEAMKMQNVQVQDASQAPQASGPMMTPNVPVSAPPPMVSEQPPPAPAPPPAQPQRSGWDNFWHNAQGKIDEAKAGVRRVPTESAESISQNELDGKYDPAYADAMRAHAGIAPKHPELAAKENAGPPKDEKPANPEDLVTNEPEQAPAPQQKASGGGGPAKSPVSDLLKASNDYEKASEGNLQASQFVNSQKMYQEQQAQDNIAKAHADNDIKMQAQEDLQQVNSKAHLEKSQQALNELNRISGEIANYKEDPDKYMKDKTGLQKVALGLSLAFGGALAGRGGGPNHAMDMINQGIDRSIAAQRAELSAKKSYFDAKTNIYGQMLNQFKNEDAAVAATKAILTDQVIRKVEGIKDVQTNQQIATNAAQLQVGLQQQAADNRKKFAFEIFGLQHPKAPAGVFAPGDKVDSKAVAMVDGQYREFATPEAAKDAKENADFRSNAIDVATRFQDALNKPKSSIPGTEAHAEVESLRSQLKDLSARGLSGGKASMGQLRLLDEVAEGGWYSNVSGNSSSKVQELKRTFNDEKNRYIEGSRPVETGLVRNPKTGQREKAFAYKAEAPPPPPPVKTGKARY